MDEAVAVGMEEVDWRNMPRKQEWSWVWRRKIQKYTQETEVSWVWRKKIQKYTQKARVVVGMEKVDWRICPRNKSGRGYGEGKFRNMPRKQERSWVWKGKY